ncbi:MAG: phage holin family protein [Pseudomonadota bacterium]|nr:phage holin family protein [Pseudomonadota bacterium]
MSVAMPSVMLQRLLNNGLQYLRVRLEILELELIEERERLGSMITRGMLLSLTALTTTQFTAALVVAAFWDTPWRLHVISLLIVVALFATVAAWLALRQLRREPARPLSTALHEMDGVVIPEIE